MHEGKWQATHERPHRELSLGTFPQVALARLLHPSPSKANTFPNVLIRLEVTLWPEF